MTHAIILSRAAIAAGFLALASPAASAPVEWQVVDGGNGHLYELVSHGPLTWADAHAVALGMGGYLATVTSADEMAFIGSVNDSDQIVFLGGTDAGAETVWLWADGPEAGQAFSYTNWAAFEPNDSGGEDYLMAYGTNAWNDVSAAYQSYYSIVEYAALSADVPAPSAAPLLVAGLGLLGVAARPRRA